ncbi:MAG: ferritin-like domain-containing protein [Comamonas sp.]
MPNAPTPTLRECARDLLLMADAAAKAGATLALAARLQEQPLDDAAIGTTLTLDDHPGIPGRPQRPALLHHTQVPRRSPFTPEGHAALIHAIAHIEFNAINLALDAIWRFAGMPAAFYTDWLRVAAEEARHFTLLAAHLATLGHAYGDFPAHDGLWTMTERTKDDIVARMALVPRTLEARGLDATPPLQAKLARMGDAAGAAILDILLADEVGHVAIGNHWYAWLCAREGLAPLPHYRVLFRRHGAPRPKPPYNLDARRAAGFTEDELAALGEL